MDLLDDEDLLNLRQRAKRTDPAAVIAEERGAPRQAPASNRDLEAWSEHQTKPRELKEPTSVAEGMCPICTTRPGRRTCNGCKRMICPGDLWTMLGLCTQCASAEDVGRWHRPATPEPTNWLGAKK